MHAARTGRIEVICGPMFSGKTEELVKRLRREMFARQRVQVFKPRIDDRYHPTDIVSHSDQRLTSVPVACAADIAAHLERSPADVVGVDEAQFLDAALVGVVDRLADRGARVILAGLELDYLGRPFGPMAELLCLAESVDKQTAICMACGAQASRSQRVHPEAHRIMADQHVREGLTSDEGDALDPARLEQVLVGSQDAYEARCRLCWVRGLDTPSLPPRAATLPPLESR